MNRVALWKKLLNIINFIIFVSTAAAISGCISDTSQKSSPQVQDSLVVSTTDDVLLGSNMQILVSIDQNSDYFMLGSVENSSNKTVKMHFVNLNDSDKFDISYSKNCYDLNSSSSCNITVLTKSTTALLKGQSIPYYITADSSDGKKLETSNHFLHVSALESSPKENATTAIGSGSSAVITIINNDDLSDMDLSGSKISFSDKDLSLTNNTCINTLSYKTTCSFTVLASNEAISNNATYSIKNKEGILTYAGKITVKRPKLSIYPDSEITLHPGAKKILIVHNTSSATASGINIIMPLSLTGVSKSTTCGTNISANGSCIITLKAGSSISGNGIISVSGSNFDTTSSKIIDTTMTYFLNLSSSKEDIFTSNNVSKKLIFTVSNLSNNKARDLKLSMPNDAESYYKIDHSLSSCDTLDDNVLPSNSSCSYTLNFIPLPVNQPDVNDINTDFSINSTIGISNSIQVNSKTFSQFYILPIDVAQGLIGSSVPDIYMSDNQLFVTDDAIYIGTTQGLNVFERDSSKWKHYTSSVNGIPGRVLAIYVSNNIIYIGTYEGLSISKDNGITWTNYTTANGLANDRIYSVYVDNDGIIYAGTFGGLSVSKDNGATWTTSIKNIAVTSIHENDDGAIYVSSYGSALSVSEDNGATWSHYTTANGLASNYIHSTYISNNTIYVGTVEGLSISKDNGTTWTNYTTANGLISDDIRSVYVDDNGAIYVGSDGANIVDRSHGGLSVSKDNGATWSHYTTANGLSNDQIYSVYVDSDGIIYAGTFGGLSVSQDNGTTWVNDDASYPVRLNTSGYVADDTIYSGSSGNGLYISTDNGITWTNYTTVNGLMSDDIYSVYVDDNTIYVGTIEGLSISKDNGITWTNYQLCNYWGGCSVISIYVDSSSTIYAGTEGKGLYISTDNGTTWTNYTTVNGLSSGYIDSVYVDDNGAIYVGSDGGLSVSKDNGATWITTLTKWVNSIFVNDNGTIYAGTGRSGLSVSKDNGAAWTNYTTENGLISNDISSVYVDENGTIYVGSDGGLSVSKDNGTTWTNYTTKNGLTSNFVSSLFISNSAIYVFNDSIGVMNIS